MLLDLVGLCVGVIEFFSTYTNCAACGTFFIMLVHILRSSNPQFNPLSLVVVCTPQLLTYTSVHTHNLRSDDVCFPAVCNVPRAVIN